MQKYVRGRGRLAALFVMPGLDPGIHEVSACNGWPYVKFPLPRKVMDCRVKPGNDRMCRYGKAHTIAVSPRDEIFVADTSNDRVQKEVCVGVGA